MENILLGLTHSFITNLSAGTINNADATLLILKTLGGVAKLSSIREALRQWRPGLRFNYLFQSLPTYGCGGYGFVGKDFHASHNKVNHQDPDGYHYSNRRTYWYRSAHGVYSITAEGYRRLAELGHG